MNAIRTIVCAIVALFVVAGNAFGVIRVQRTLIGGATSTTDYASGAPITLNVTNTDDEIRIWSTQPSQEDIGRVTLQDGGGSNLVSVVLSQSGGFSTIPLPTPAARHWAGLSTTRSNVRLIGRISGNLTDSIAVGNIWRLDVGGTISANILSGLHATDTINPLRITAGEIAPCVIEARGMSIATDAIFSAEVAGDMRASLLAQQGNIRDILVEGDIGVVGDFVHIEAKNRIRIIECNSLYAVIDSDNDNADGGTLNVKAVGDFDGLMILKNINPNSIDVGGIRIGGDVYGTIDHKENRIGAGREIVIGGSLQSSGLILVGGGLDENSRIEIGAEEGLQGQIIFNAAGYDEQDLCGQAMVPCAPWEGPVEVDETPLLPGYLQTAASVGGGSAGQAPFDLHTTSCDPPDGASFPDPGTLIAVRMRYYGPIDFDTANTPVVIESRQIGSSGSWNTLTPSDFEYWIDPSDPRSLWVEEKTGSVPGFAGGLWSIA